MRLSVGAKLLGGFEFVVLMAIFLGVGGRSRLGTMNGPAIKLYNRDLGGLQDIAQARAAFDGYRLASAQSLAASSPAERSLQLSRQAAAEGAFAQALGPIQYAASSADSGTLSGQLATTWSQYKSLNDQATALANAGNTSDAAKISQTTARDREDAVSGLLGQLNDLRGRIATDQARQGVQTYERVRLLTVGLLVATLL